jgi:hypothetical protein
MHSNRLVIGCIIMAAACGGAWLAGPAPSAGASAPHAIRVTPAATLRASVRTPVATQAGSTEAKQAITSYAASELGIQVTVMRAAAADLPAQALSAQVQSSVNAAVELAARSYGGILSNGQAIVAYGSGKISGDITAEMSYGSLGEFVLVSPAKPPTDAAGALAVVKQAFPAIAGLNWQADASSAGSFTFYASGYDSTLNPKSLKAETVAVAALAGTTTAGQKTSVWVVLGRGKFATSIAIP